MKTADGSPSRRASVSSSSVGLRDRAVDVVDENQDLSSCLVSSLLR